MPTNRRFRTRQRREFLDRIELDADLKYDLMHGACWFAGFGDDLGAMERAWRQHRHRLHAECVAVNPGHRPWMEWYCELIPTYGPRELTDQGRTALERVDGDISRLVHRKFRTEFLHDGGGWQEREINYLLRHHLLEPGERERFEMLERHEMARDHESIKQIKRKWFACAGLGPLTKGVF